MLIKFFLFLFFISNLNQLINSSVIKFNDNQLKESLIKLIQDGTEKNVNSIQLIPSKYEESIGNEIKSYINTESLKFDKSLYTSHSEFNYVPKKQLECEDRESEDNALCSTYQANHVICKNLNYKSSFESKFECKMEDAKVTNKNLYFGYVLTCLQPTEPQKDVIRFYPNSCYFRYHLTKNDDYKESDDKGDKGKKGNGEDGLAGWAIALIVIGVLIGISAVGFVIRKKIMK